MLTRILKSLLHEYRAHPMARLTLWTLAYGVALWLAGRFSGGAPGLLWLVFWGSAIASAGYYAVRLVQTFKDRVLWRLSRRLVVTYLFIAAIPIVLILSLVALGATMINGQFAAFLVTLRLNDRVDELTQINRVVEHEAHMTRARTPRELMDYLRQFYSSELAQHAQQYPGLEITARLGSQASAYRLDGTSLPDPVTVPTWLHAEEFKGIVVQRGRLFLRAVVHGQTPVGDLTLVLSQPFTPQLLDVVGAGIGPVGVLVPETRAEAAQAANPEFEIQTAGGKSLPAKSIVSKSVQLPPQTNAFDLTVLGASTLNPIRWGGASEQQLGAPVFVYVRSRLATLDRRLIETLGPYSRAYVTIFTIIAVALLVIELLSMIMGIRLTRTITGTVDRLYNATERVRAGDLSFRIGLPARDQLSALGEAFDTMTASVERLLRDAQEKTRLENEVEIAREVQRQLFPQSIPKVPGLDLYGTCIPARGVSGDYYDFLRVGSRHVTIVLGDVSGKGISAALLMAAIQSAVRAQLYRAVSGDSAAQERELLSTAEVVRRLSRQLFETTPAEKYATFFYAVYDVASRRLTYTNAGHPPPMLFRGEKVQRLDVGGTAVGLFPGARFEQTDLLLEAGDLLLAFTDGITEPENNYEEEFGESRVIEVVSQARGGSPEEVAREIYRSVNDWTGSPELQDDMTLIIARCSG